MSSPSQPQEQLSTGALRARMIGVLGVLVGVNALFVLAVVWGVSVLLPTTVALVAALFSTGPSGVTAILGDLIRFPLSVPATVGLIGLFLAGQIYYGYRRVLAGTRGTDTDEEHAVARTVRKLAMAADVPEPAVRVVDDPDPSCYTIGRVTDATIVVTTGLIETLDADQLEAVLAHEVAHVINRDVTLMTITTLFVEITDRVYHGTRLVRRKLSPSGNLSAREQVLFQYGFLLAVLLYVLVSPVLWLFPRAANWATRSLSHTREYAADAAAARMTGKPLALATALTELGETTTAPETDLRLVKTCALCIVPTALVTGSQTESLPEISRPARPERRDSQVSSWLETNSASTAAGHFETHPPVEKRIRRLREIATQMEERR